MAHIALATGALLATAATQGQMVRSVRSNEHAAKEATVESSAGLLHKNQYVDPKNIIQGRREIISHIERVPNLGIVDTPRYELTLVDGRRTHLHGHDIESWLNHTY